VNCQRCGALKTKLVCENCARALSNAAFAAQQKQYAEIIISERAPLVLIQAFARGTNDGTKWHIRRLGADRRHALCGVFFRSRGGAREARLSQLVDLKPICGPCYEALQELVNIQPAVA
jgi:hypothetical protein